LIVALGVIIVAADSVSCGAVKISGQASRPILIVSGCHLDGVQQCSVVGAHGMGYVATLIWRFLGWSISDVAAMAYRGPKTNYF
jgi:hypothetical protein